MGGSKKRKKRNSGGGGGLLGKLHKKSSGHAAHANANLPDQFLGAEAEAKMAERKAQREQLRELRARSVAEAADAADAADEGNDDRRASKKRRKERHAKVRSTACFSPPITRPQSRPVTVPWADRQTRGITQREQAEPVPEETEGPETRRQRAASPLARKPRDPSGRFPSAA